MQKIKVIKETKQKHWKFKEHNRKMNYLAPPRITPINTSIWAVDNPKPLGTWLLRCAWPESWITSTPKRITENNKPIPQNSEESSKSIVRLWHTNSEFTCEKVDCFQPNLKQNWTCTDLIELWNTGILIASLW